MGDIGSVLAHKAVRAGSLELEFVSRSYQLTKARAVTALTDANLTIESGEFAVIMGHSGSGKTTLLNILGLLDMPTSGQYYVGGTPTVGLGQAARAHLRRDKFGFVFQSFQLLERYTVAQNIELSMMYRPISQKTSRSLTASLLGQLGLADKADVYPHQLSGGQAQRIAIARAIIHNPPIILADEPTGNLDASAAREVVNLLHMLNAKGATVVMVTHDPSLVRSTDRLITVDSGRIIKNEVGHD